MCHSRRLTDEEICELLECTSDTECSSVRSNSSESESDVLDDIVNESEDEMQDVQYTELIVTETNHSGKQFITKRATLSKPYKKWKNVTSTEVRVFIACLLIMGLNKRPTMLPYWSKKPSQAFPWFGKMFSAHQFRHLMKCFHLVDSEKCPAPCHPDYDPCIKYQPLVDHANNVFRHHYTPHEQLSTDEKVPKAKDKAEIARHGLGYCVVQKILCLGNYLSKGYHIFVDNFFMSVPFVKSLYKLGTYITGTVRKSRKYLPEQFRKKFGIGGKMYCKSGPILACACREKESQCIPIILLSSKVGSGDIEVKNKNKTVKKPEIILKYNQYVGGIDTSDMMLYAHLVERCTLR
ncbi:piggyBac transposable element-derived protein 4-like [Schistocerca piceifrons]|uniref:piggyBac transposable element-derived protein 4-like n=1 Tax=Schistocerca piceifrons TaxID=274613 RepID=UPI001F5F2682|nr:piggyBac transposable element-derived protein 4-like [Schistocerca piceifrons]